MKQINTLVSLLLGVLIVLPCIGAASSDKGNHTGKPASVQITVDAKPKNGYWINTGILVKKGEILHIQYVSGQWNINPRWGPVDGAGSSKYIARKGFLLPGFAEGCLVGQIGGTASGGGKAFFAGNLSTVPTESEGILWLATNDSPHIGHGFGDNSGSILVEIIKHPH